MERIIDTTAVVALPAPPTLSGTTGYFTEGSPGVTPATRVRAWWVNMVQEELLALLTAAGITPDATATNFTQVLAAIKIVATGRLLNQQVFGTAGTFTYTPTAGTKTIVVDIVGGGGAGGGAVATGANGSAGAPGTGGSFSRGIFAMATFGATATVVVGAAGVAAAGAAGGNGGASSFAGTGLTAPGGPGGGVGSNGTPPLFAGGNVGTVGVGITGTIFLSPGWEGGLSLCLATGVGQSTGGPGGNSPFGAGGGQVTASTAGLNATGHGAGGGGTANGASFGNNTGGNGSPGLVIVSEFT